MSEHDPGVGSVETHYECTRCGYSAPVDVGIGLCPTCRETIPTTTVLR
jgi:rubrerythrin